MSYFLHPDYNATLKRYYELSSKRENQTITIDEAYELGRLSVAVDGVNEMLKFQHGSTTYPSEINLKESN